MSGNLPRGVHGLPARPAFQAQPQAGPSRPSNNRNGGGGAGGHQRHATFPRPPPQQAAYPYGYPYGGEWTNTSGGYQAQNASGGYQPGPYSWPQPQYPHHGYAYQPTATPEGYSYSAAYQPQLSAIGRDGHRRIRTGPGHTPQHPAHQDPPTVRAWRNCSQPGCMFVGSADDVEIHEGDRHLIFPNGKPVERSEEEERWARNKGPAPPIEGTGIVLQTDEDIAKWIAERKAKWPSAKRVAEKDEEREAAIARGENPDRGRGRGRGGGRGGSGRRADPASQAEDWGRPAVDNAAAGPSRGTGRGRGQARGRGSIRGTGAYVPTPIITEPTPHDTLPDATDSKVENDESPDIRVKGKGKEADESGSSSGDSSSGSDSDSDDETPVTKVSQTTTPKTEASSKPVCRFFAKNGRCKMGNKCRFSHIIEGKGPAPVPSEPPRPKGPKQPPAKRANPFEKPSMLGALLATPINNTLSQLTQTIRFLVANDMLDGVELKPGDAEQQAKDQTKVQMVEEGDAAMIE